MHAIVLIWRRRDSQTAHIGLAINSISTQSLQLKLVHPFLTFDGYDILDH